MAGPSADHERHRLLSGWCDGSLDDAELERLDELLRTDPGFRDFYVKYMDQHAVLAAAVLPIGDVRLMVQCPGPAEDEPTGDAEAVRAGSGQIRDRRDRATSRVPRAWRRWVALAAVLLLAGMIASRGRRVAPGRPSSPGRPSRATPRGWGSQRGFAVVIQLDGAEWEPGNGRRPSEGDLLAAGRLVLRSGRMTLGLLSGVTLTVEGPADLELLSIDRVHCRRGKLRTRVPRGAEGFIVSTPGSAVVDLGTEFGLNVADDGKAQLMVFKGEAEAAVLNAAGRRSGASRSRNAARSRSTRGAVRSRRPRRARWSSSHRRSWPARRWGWTPPIARRCWPPAPGPTGDSRRSTTARSPTRSRVARRSARPAR